MQLLGYGNAVTPAGIRTVANTSDGIIDLNAVAQRGGLSAPMSTDQLIEGGDGAAKELVAAVSTTDLLDPANIEFAPCLTAPEKIICIGLNYRSHAEEVGRDLPEYPVVFNKFNNALLGHRGVINLPSDVDEKFDYEAELVIVIGKTARSVSQTEALSHVFGYCVGNDFSARGLQRRTAQFTFGKTSDGFGPIGPWLVPADLISDPDGLDIECVVNGETRQSSNTSDLIFGCAELVSYLSSAMTLKPGDIIYTGTPSGVVAGFPDPKPWLKAGDQIVTRIAELGELEFSLA